MTEPITVLIADDQQMVRRGFRVILEAEPDINLLKLVTDYVDRVTAFYAWLHNAQVAEHRADIDATNVRIDELHRLFPFPE